MFPQCFGVRMNKSCQKPPKHTLSETEWLQDIDDTSKYCGSPAQRARGAKEVNHSEASGAAHVCIQRHELICKDCLKY